MVSVLRWKRGRITCERLSGLPAAMAGPHARKVGRAGDRRAPHYPPRLLCPSWHLLGRRKGHTLRGGIMFHPPGTGGGGFSAGFSPRQGHSGPGRRAGEVRGAGGCRPRPLAPWGGSLSASHQQLRALLRVVLAGGATKLSGGTAHAVGAGSESSRCGGRRGLRRTCSWRGLGPSGRCRRRGDSADLIAGRGFSQGPADRAKRPRPGAAAPPQIGAEGLRPRPLPSGTFHQARTDFRYGA